MESTRRIVIEPDYLVVITGYEDRCEESELAKRIQNVFEDNEDQLVYMMGLTKFCRKTTDEEDKEMYVETLGLKFKVDSMVSIDQILDLYRKEWYCKCFQVCGQEYCLETKTLYVWFDAESG